MTRVTQLNGAGCFHDKASFRIISALALALPASLLLISDAVAQRRQSPELIQTCTRAARAGVPDGTATGADRSREMIYRACIANGGLSARTQAAVAAREAAFGTPVAAPLTSYAPEPAASYPQFSTIDGTSELADTYAGYGRPLGLSQSECMTDEGYGRWSACR